MGFFGKVKDALGQLTGSSGNVQMQLSTTQLKRGDSVNASVTVNATGPFKAKGVYLQITGTEHIKFDVEMPDNIQPGGSQIRSTHTEHQTKDNQTYQNQQALAVGEFQMNAGESKQYSGTVQVPEGVLPTYRGVDAQHTWIVRAFVDVPMGGDPSAETEITVL
jgi:Arrestin (or S-antigen), N-terminal domain